MDEAAGMQFVQFLSSDQTELHFVDLSALYERAACAFLDRASHLFLSVGGDHGSVFFNEDLFPQDEFGTQMRALVPKNFWKIGTTIKYRCSYCGIEEDSRPMAPPPALGVYPLPQGWHLVDTPDPNQHSELECVVCYVRPF